MNQQLTAKDIVQVIADAPRNIEAILKSKSQAELARTMGITYRTLLRWEKRETSPNAFYATRLMEEANALQKLQRR